MNFFPIAINIENEKILLIGGGKVASHKIPLIQKYADDITVCSGNILDEIKTMDVSIIEKDYYKDVLDPFFLVYACTDNKEVNEQIRKDCLEKKILVNLVDNPTKCQFVSPAIYRDKNISVAVTSNGENVYKSIEVRDKIKGFLEND